MLTGFVFECQKAINELAKTNPKERSLAIAKIMVIILLTIVLIALAFNGVARFNSTIETMIKISNY